jgi:hypothetical protein
MRRILGPGLAAVVVTSACTPGYGRGPASWTDHVEDAAVGQCDTIAVGIPNGADTPTDVVHLAATCEDARVCEIRHDERNVWVHGLSAGATDVRLAFEHPATGVLEEHRVRVVFRPPVKGDALHPTMMAGNTCDAFDASASGAP